LKPPRFAYHDPATVDEALSLLSEHGDEAKVLAGGQSLVPLLNFRLARPEHLVDVNRLGELAGMRRADGVLRIGALARQAALERSPLVAEQWPLITQAMKHVAHPQIRNRGTVGGSVAHADAAAELPAVLCALDARIRARSVRGERVVAAREFFHHHLTTALEPDELVVEIEVPAVVPGTGTAFVEFARRHGDFALGGAAVLLCLDAGGTCTAATVWLVAAAPVPVHASAAERQLEHTRVDEASATAAAAAAGAGIEPSGDVHGSSVYRRRVIETTVRRAVLLAARRAGAP
jgi:carbon-monoxide dehydrogenase medium subunit/6-hydroxypseudooxynicotine dehydrogenase subunit alpha